MLHLCRPFKELYININLYKHLRGTGGKKFGSVIWKTHEYGKRLGNRMLSNTFWFETHKEKPYSFCEAAPITSGFRNSCEDKGKPDKTSKTYRIKLCHHSTRNRHGIPTHPWRVPTDPNLPICTMPVCAALLSRPCILYSNG